MGWFGVVGGTKGHGQCHHSIERIRLLFKFNRKYAAILYRFRDIVESRRFLPTAPAFGAPAGGDPGGISLGSLASVNEIPWAIVWRCLCDTVFSRFSRTPTCDRQTDRHKRKHGNSIYRAIAWCRAVKIINIGQFLLELYLIMSGIFFETSPCR